jgi:signal peptidase
MITKRIKELLLRFWRSKNDVVVIIRDATFAFIIVLTLLIILWAYTGQWFTAPMVAIESGSMEHSNPPFGRLGTIDAGDMVLLKKVTKHEDIIPHGGPYGGAEKEKGWRTYGDYGDVVIYKPLGDDNVSQIIHRCITYVTVTMDEHGNTYYTIPDYNIYNETSVTIPSLGLYHFPPAPQYHWKHSGYLTKGDNNNVVDQATTICPQPVKLEWITGKARSEIPWFGIVNLFFEDVMHGKNTLKNVHEDSYICFFLVVGGAVSIPIIWDIHDYIKDKKKMKKEEKQPDINHEKPPL